MKHTITLLTVVLLAALAMTTAAAEESASRDHLDPVRLQMIELGGFWKQQAKRLTEKWLPHCILQMEKGGRGIFSITSTRAAAGLNTTSPTNRRSR